MVCSVVCHVLGARYRILESCSSSKPKMERQTDGRGMLPQPTFPVLPRYALVRTRHPYTETQGTASVPTLFGLDEVAHSPALFLKVLSATQPS